MGSFWAMYQRDFCIKIWVFLSIWMFPNQWQAGLMWYLSQKNHKPQSGSWSNHCWKRTSNMKWTIICPLLYCTFLAIKKMDVGLNFFSWPVFKRPQYKRAMMLFPEYLPSFMSYMLEPLLNVNFKLRTIPAIHKINALREVLWQRVGKFLLKSIITLCQELQHYPSKSKFGIWLFAKNCVIN